MNNQPLLTVIIPMYGVEKFIAKCLDSIIAQSYSNMEILCVNDGTKDRSAEIAEEYAKRDERVRVINNPQNMGLFRARVEGLKVANGEYIAFVDADDYIGIDWFRLLIKKITEEKADMVIGNTVNVDENGNSYYYNNYRKLTSSHAPIEGDEVLKTLYTQEGGCFIWHTVWNKVYSAELIKKCMPYLLRVDFHMIMGEDIAFSSVFYTHARKLAFADADCYFYYRHSEASTSLSLPKEKIIKNIYDLGTVFDFAESCLESYDSALYEHYKPLISNFKSRYQRIWRGNIWSAQISEDPAALDAMESTFGVRNGELPRPHDFYFYELTTPWSSRYEDLKKAIYWEQNQVISFDIFDTLIMRPFYAPTDLFLILGKKAAALLPYLSEDSFAKMRQLAEAEARKASKYDDITLSEIYTAFSKLYNVSDGIAKQLQKLEEETELEFCYARKSAKELFDFALSLGKRVIITSDMYLEKSTVEAILAKNGYVGYEHLFLSSDTKILKADGKIFSHIIKILGVEPNQILHIGDNWNSDISAAQNKGLNTYFLPKATETFENGISDIYTGNSASPFRIKHNTSIDSSASFDQLPLRCAVATAANHCFDNPFEFFQEKSNFNGNVYYMGYYALGIHVLGIANWIYNTAVKNNYKKIVFLARDGKMVKEAFDYLCKKKNASITSEYFYATRKALMPYSIKAAEDFYKINTFIDYKEHTPSDIIELFSDILKPLDSDSEEKYEGYGVKVSEPISSEEEYYKFISALISISYDEKKVSEKFDEASAAFRKVFDASSATFDVGYSGRLQSIICDLAGCSVDAFYIHTNGYRTDLVTDNKFEIQSYYDYTPTITGIIREYFISAPEPSCYKYSFSDGTVHAELEEMTDSLAYDAIFAIKEMQKAAVSFCKNYIDIFGNIPGDFTARKSDYALAFDHMLLAATEFDRYTFSNSVVEDEVYSGYTAKSLFEIWSWHLSVLVKDEVDSSAPQLYPIADNENYIYIANAGKVKKAITYLLYDRKKMKDKFKYRFRNHKIFLGVCGFLYSIPRAFYRLLKK